MKRFVIIGLGNFGSNIAESLYSLGHDVIAIDTRSEVLDPIAPHVTRAVVGDGRQLEVLERLGAKECDVGVISMGDDIAASILATLALRDLDVKEIYVKVMSFDHARIMKRMEVTETIFPEHEAALNLGTRLSRDPVFNYVNLGKNFGIQEMTVPDKWEGRTLRDLNLRVNYHISIVAIKDILTQDMHVPPDPDALLKDSDTLLVVGKDSVLERLAKLK